MKITKNETMTISIAVLLMLSMSASLILIPSASANSSQVPTYMYVSVSPNPIGVGQTVYVNFWVNSPPPTATAQYGDRWQNLTVVVTKPDKTTQTLGPYTSDATGGTSTTYTPSAVGNYTFQSFFGGQTLAGNNLPPHETPSMFPSIGDYYEPSTSSVFTLTVQSTPIASAPVTSLPTTYWSRPINALNNNWYSIAGNWLGLFSTSTFPGTYNATGNYNPYTTAPTTAHILWTKPEAFGGTIGGEFGGSETGNYYSTAQYEVKFSPIIMQGILYYTQYPGSINYPAANVAVDLQTGQTLWTDNAANYGGGSPTQSALTTSGIVTPLSNGQILNYVSPNQYGGEAYLWTAGVLNGISTTSKTTAYNMFDAMTGDYILSVVNVPVGLSLPGLTLPGLTLTEDEHGDMIGYYVNSTTSTAPTLGEWNSTLAIFNYGFQTGGLYAAAPIDNLWTWRPSQGGVVPFSDGIEWTAPIATSISGAPIALTYSGISSGVILMNEYGITGSATGSAFQNGWIVEAGYSSTTGTQLWITNRTEIPNTRISIGASSNGNTGASIGDGVFVECNLDTLTVTGYSLYTGAHLWGPETFPNANPYTSLALQQIVANGTIYIWTLGGDVYAYNIATGALIWQYHTQSGGIDSPYGVEPLWPYLGTGLVAGGILFLAEGHEFAPPLFRGAQLLALNTANGQEVWSMEAFDVNGVKAISDGIMTTINAYDNQIYAYGMGPSKTTVTAPSVGVTTATPVTIAGTVMDISAGSQQNAVATNFPNGLPCVSDASMSQFMEAVYEQQPMPTNVTGVPVTLSVIDSNHNTRPIGTTTTDASGTYAFTWTPDIPGNFTVIATFAGSNSYYASSAETHFYASTPSATPAPTATPASNLATVSDVTIGIAAAVIAIIIAIAIVGLLLLRKKP